MLPAGLRDFSPAQEVQYFRYILDEILAGHDEGQRLYADWARGKDARAADWVAKMKQLYPELYRSIVITRNQDWVPRIRSMLTQPKPTMIVVGLYHLVGPDSIQVVSSKSAYRGRIWNGSRRQRRWQCHRRYCAYLRSDLWANEKPTTAAIIRAPITMMRKL